jgi:hypothetical protein
VRQRVAARRQRRQRSDDPAALVLPAARLTIYPDSAHGFRFQHHSQVAADVNAFLAAAG